ncbi:hypothetical protein LIER_28940 [Lithospermum erythrorhizon]|uniref:Uncharacterized protein n=1 Tax=Lithospermum erythrorhizon TaxID=34254 RepID=A0AAV3RHG5_LITER
MYSYETTTGFQLTSKGPIAEVRKGNVTRFGSIIKVRLISCPSEKNLDELCQVLTNSEFDCIPIVIDTLQLEVDGVIRFWVLVVSQGISLAKLSNMHQHKFFEKSLISEFYQKILKDLLVVTKNLMETPFKGVMKSNNIFVWTPVEGDFPRVILTNFKKKDCASNEWGDLAKLIENINRKIDFHIHCKQPDMEELINALKAPNKENLEEIKYYPVFWRRSQRRNFLVSIGGGVNRNKSSKFYSVDTAKKVFGDNFKGWYSTIKFSYLDYQMIGFFDRSYTAPKETKKSGRRLHFLNALTFFRNVYAHSSWNLSNSRFSDKSVDDLQAHLENLFPLLVWEMYLKDKKDKELIPQANLVSFY